MDGFRVNLAQLDMYTKALTTSQEKYHQIEGQLAGSNLATVDPEFSTLVSNPEYAGPQTEFRDACVTFLTTYKDLHAEIYALHKQISDKLNFMVQEFTNTSALYQEAEKKSNELYQGLLRDFHAAKKKES